MLHLIRRKKDFIASYPEYDHVASYPKRYVMISYPKPDLVAAYPEQEFLVLANFFWLHLTFFV